MLHKKGNFILGYISKTYIIEDNFFYFFNTRKLERLSADQERKKVTNVDELFLVS